MFIRTKKINKKEYAYIVKNTWKKRKTEYRQKVSSYLGRVYKLKKTINNQLEADYQKQSYKKTILDLIRLELLNHGFKEIKKNTWQKETFMADLKNKKVYDFKNKKNICLEINNNFLCSYTLRKLANFTPKKGLTELQIGKQLANAFEAAGILISKEVFIFIAQKILKEVKRF